MEDHFCGPSSTLTTLEERAHGKEPGTWSRGASVFDPEDFLIGCVLFEVRIPESILTVDGLAPGPFP